MLNQFPEQFIGQELIGFILAEHQSTKLAVNIGSQVLQGLFGDSLHFIG
jgi:hypothetical protein